jgi:hypothetical protein
MQWIASSPVDSDGLQGPAPVATVQVVHDIGGHMFARCCSSAGQLQELWHLMLSRNPSKAPSRNKLLADPASLPVHANALQSDISARSLRLTERMVSPREGLTLHGRSIVGVHP